MAGQLERITVKIASGASVSGDLDLSGRRVVAMQTPAAWSAAGLTFNGRATDKATRAETGVTAAAVAAPPYNPIVGTNGLPIFAIATAVVAVANSYIVFTTTEREALASVRIIQVQSGTKAATVNQGADRYLFLICEPRI